MMAAERKAAEEEDVYKVKKWKSDLLKKARTV